MINGDGCLKGYVASFLIYFIIFYSMINIYYIMIIDAKTLKEILNHVPDEFEVEYYDCYKNISHPISDKVEINISEKKLVLKS